MDKTEIGR